MLNLDDGLAGVVFPVCLARVVFARGVDRPRDVFAIPAFADDDENVVHLTVVEPCPEFSTAAVTKAFAWLVSSETTGATAPAVPDMGFASQGFSRLVSFGVASNSRK